MNTITAKCNGFKTFVVSQTLKGKLKAKDKLKRFYKGELGDGGGVPGWVIGIVAAIVLALIFIPLASGFITDLMDQSKSKVNGLW